MHKNLRRLAAGALVAGSILSVPAVALAYDDPKPPPSSDGGGGAAAASRNQCNGIDISPGREDSLATYFFGRTVVRISSGSPSSWYWWSSSTSAGGALPNGGSTDLSRSFAGFRVGFHNTGQSTIHVSTPYGPC